VIISARDFIKKVIEKNETPKFLSEIKSEADFDRAEQVLSS